VFLNQQRILMVVHAYYKEDTRVRREADALIDAGKQVDVVCLNKGVEPTRESFNGVTIHRLPVSRSVNRSKVFYILEYLWFALLSFFKVSWFFLRHRPRVVMVHNMPNFLVFSALLPRLFGAKVVLDMHDVMPELYVTLFNIKGGFLKKLLFIEEKISAKFASRVMTVNQVVCDLLAKRLNKELFIIHNTPDAAVLKVNAPLPRVTQKFNLFHHGNIHQRYGLVRMVEVMKSLNSQSDDFHLEVHGRGLYYEDIKAQAKALGIMDSCQFNGGFKPEMVGNMLVNADAGLVLNYPSDFMDVLLPVKMLEYVACKVPVITSRIKASEACFGEDMMYYFDDDAELEAIIRQIQQDPQAAAVKAEKAYQHYLTLQWDSEKKRLVDFIDNL
jgi:glycosyltransferase involved in cell wall biosynthesis